MLEHFAGRLKEAIGDKSARSFALECGISPAGLHKYLAAISEPTLSVLDRIAKVSGVNVGWLVNGEGPRAGMLEVIGAIEHIMLSLDAVLSEVKYKMPPTQKAKLAAMVLDDVIAHKIEVSAIHTKIEKYVDLLKN